MAFLKPTDRFFPWHMLFTGMVGSSDVHRALPAIKYYTKIKQNLNNKRAVNQVLDCKKPSNLGQSKKTAMISF